LLRTAVVLGLVPALNSCVNPAHETAQVEEIIALGQGINNLQFYINDLEERIDSLVGAIARQDTAISRVAEFTGLVLPGRGGR
jgi:hypothetical protein